MSFIRYGDLYSASSRHYYSEATPSQSFVGLGLNAVLSGCVKVW